MKQSVFNIDFHQPQVMAILNVTPDSFYSGGRTFFTSEIEARVKTIINDGASIIDVGGYSSRPGAEHISVEEEWSRIERGIEAIRLISSSIAISIDTFRSEVIERAINKFGAIIINDITAGEYDPQIINLAAKHNMPYIAMHMRGTPQTMQEHAKYDDVVMEIVQYFKSKTLKLRELGLSEIIIDPGFGFAKTLDQNYALMSGIECLCSLGYPVLSGVSRKSMIYKLLDCSPSEALAGTIALNWESLRGGASILRVHDVKEAVDVVKIFSKYKSQIL
ncbi:MAG: dihydropteroate synthase [Rikenellaceae bacterium]